MAVILHVSEAWGGGIVTATEWIAAQAPEHEHHVLYLPRGDIGRAPDSTIFSQSFEHQGSRASFARQARRIMASPTYDVVHSHSSWAGALCRLAGTSRARQFYSPHCFAFERQDINAATRRMFRGVESIAVDRTHTLVANGDHEAQLASRLGHRHVLSMPMVGVAAPVGIQRRTPSAVPRIVTVGRVAPQKDPAYFARLVRIVRQRTVGPVDAVWIGAPDMDNESEILTANNIRVTGWLDAESVADELSQATCYVHSAAWEAGAPLAMLDAARNDVPVVARYASCLSWTGFTTAASLGEHASMVATVLHDDVTRAGVLEDTRRALIELERAAAAVDLGRTYGSHVRLLAA